MDQRAFQFTTEATALTSLCSSSRKLNGHVKIGLGINLSLLKDHKI